MPSGKYVRSDEMRKHVSLVNTKNRKCSVEGCEKPHEAHGMCKSHWTKHRRKTDPEYREKSRKKSMENYFKHHEKRKESKNTKQKLVRADLYKKLGGKCVSCGEKFNESLSRSNLEFHHKFYDEDDEKIRQTHKGNLGSKHHWEIKRMLKKGENPKLKFTLLCKQCNVIEAHVRINKTKAFETFCWLSGEGYFDEALSADPKLKKLSEFMK